jgi:chemotaxis methyl-accepting protein methylase
MRRNNNPHLKPLEQAMAARFGWQTNASWRDTLIEAIQAKADKLGLDELSYCQQAIRSPGELEVLAGLLCNSETRFFRESEQFEALMTRVLPELISVRGKERKLALWSAACSTGEEAYSLAIALCETLPKGENWKTSLLATDLRGQAIISASQGRYPSSAIRMVDPHLRGGYFVKADMHGRERAYAVIPAVRQMIAFRRANIYDGSFWKNLDRQFDLILCNNLLLYFHALAVRQTVDRFAKVLKRGGLLMVMKNEGGYIDHAQLRYDPTLPGAFFRKV